MAFVRAKSIKGSQYFYLVEGYRDGAKVRQRVLLYLGPHSTVKAAHRHWSQQARRPGPEQKHARSMVKALERYL